VLGNPVLENDRSLRGSLASLEAPFVGRERELKRLSGLLAEALDLKNPRLVLAYGTAGIGKSRLTTE
jgi:Cdc6-like AAA superfamily ATPase